MIQVLGDIHGNALKLKALLKNKTEYTEDDVVILAGDVGILYGGEKMGRLLKEMKSFPCKFIVMRGNHDDRYWASYPKREESFETLDIFGSTLGYQKKYPNVLYVKDEGDILTIEGKTYLFIPGAYSVDKFYRIKQQMPYCPDEQLTTDEMNALTDRIMKHDRIDVVISHTCPLSWQSQFEYLFLSFLDQSKVDKTTDKFLDYVNDLLIKRGGYDVWLFGHFHDDIYIDTGHENCKACMLYLYPYEIK